MKRFIKLVTLAIVIKAGSAFGQTPVATDNMFIPPSPNSTWLTRFGSIDVSYYTGVPNISVPLFELPTRESPVPVNLQYHASGIRVQDVASSVGLGWNLNAGGAITRIVRGQPDEIPPCNSTTGQYQMTLPNPCDSQHDQYFFSFLGRTGKFVYSSLDNTTITLPYQDVEIKPSGSHVDTPPYNYYTVSSWSITDENGFVYVFGDSPSNKETTTYSIGDHTNPSSFTTSAVSNVSYTSTWYLSQVISPKGFTVATFSYSQGADVTYYMYGQKELYTFTSTPASPVTSRSWVDTKIVTNAPKYISIINSDLGSISFNYSSTIRQDLLGAWALSSASIYDVSNSLIKTYSFNYQQPNQDIHYEVYGGVLGCNYSYNSNCTDPDCYRFMLSNITESQNIPYRAFTYNTTQQLPSRTSVCTDHWGYYNGFLGMYCSLFGSSSLYYVVGYDWTTKLPYMHNYPYTGQLILGMDGSYGGGMPKMPADGVLANILTTITYPSGGSTNFIFAPNYNFAPYSVGGGCSVSSITEKNTDGSIVKQSTYTYGGAVAFAAPSIADYYITFTEGGYTRLLRYSDIQTNLYDLNGSSIGFSTVTETALDGSQIIRSYTNYNDLVYASQGVSADFQNFVENLTPTFYTNDLPGTVGCTTNGVLNSEVSCSNFNNIGSIVGVPYAPPTSRAFARGLLKKTSYYDNHNNILKTDSYNYYCPPTISNLYNRVVMNVPSNGANHFLEADYYDLSIPVLLTSKTSILYDQTDVTHTRSVSSTANYLYSSVVPTFPSSISTSVGMGQSFTTLYKYPQEIAAGITLTGADIPSIALSSMLTNHIIRPVEVVKAFGSSSPNVISAGISTYQLNSFGKPVPYGIYDLPLSNSTPLSSFTWASIVHPVLNTTAFTFNAPFVLRSSFTYDANSNLASTQSSDGTIQNLQWGSSYSYGLVTNTTLNAGSFPSNYTYNTIEGLLTKTDPNGQGQSYVYDDNARLKLTKDQDGNILTRFRYNYQNSSTTMDTPAFTYSTRLNSDGSTLVNFSATPINKTLGVTAYNWDFGDGQVLENGGLNPVHTYAAGTFNVKLIVTNAEYLPNSVAQWVNINGGL